MRDGSSVALLVRHGRTPWNVAGRFLGHTDQELDAVGQAQARAVAQALASVPVAHVISSPLRRAVATAEPIAAVHGLPFALHPQLLELDHGRFEGCDLATARSLDPQFWRAFARDPADTCIPGGETLRASSTRAMEAFHGALAQDPARPVVLVSHQLVLAGLLCLLLDEDFAGYRRHALVNGAITAVAWREGVARLLVSNHQDHLREVR